MGNRGYLPSILVASRPCCCSRCRPSRCARPSSRIKFRFGEIVRADYKPGLHFMTPIVNNIASSTSASSPQDYPAEQFLTSEGKILRIDFYVKWRISDVSPLLHLDDRRQRGGRRTAASAKSSRTASRASIARAPSSRSSRRSAPSSPAKCSRSRSDATSAELGIELVDVRVKSIELPERGERVGVQPHARRTSRAGRAAARRGLAVVRADARRGRSQAHRDPRRRRTRDAQIMRGEGDAAAARHLRARPMAAIRSSTRSTAACRPTGARSGKQGDVLVLRRTASSSST